MFHIFCNVWRKFLIFLTKWLNSLDKSCIPLTKFYFSSTRVSFPSRKNSYRRRSLVHHDSTEKDKRVWHTHRHKRVQPTHFCVSRAYTENNTLSCSVNTLPCVYNRQHDSRIHSTHWCVVFGTLPWTRNSCSLDTRIVSIWLSLTYTTIDTNTHTPI